MTKTQKNLKYLKRRKVNAKIYGTEKYMYTYRKFTLDFLLLKSNKIH